VHPNRTVEQHLAAVDREIEDLDQGMELVEKRTRKQLKATALLIALLVTDLVVTLVDYLHH
jgi:hypothetical protein